MNILPSEVQFKIISLSIDLPEDPSNRIDDKKNPFIQFQNCVLVCRLWQEIGVKFLVDHYKQHYNDNQTVKETIITLRDVKHLCDNSPWLVKLYNLSDMNESFSYTIDGFEATVKENTRCIHLLTYFISHPVFINYVAINDIQKIFQKCIEGVPSRIEKKLDNKENSWYYDQLFSILANIKPQSETNQLRETLTIKKATTDHVKWGWNGLPGGM